MWATPECRIWSTPQHSAFAVCPGRTSCSRAESLWIPRPWNCRALGRCLPWSLRLLLLQRQPPRLGPRRWRRCWAWWESSGAGWLCLSWCWSSQRPRLKLGLMYQRPLSWSGCSGRRGLVSGPAAWRVLMSCVGPVCGMHGRQGSG